MAAYVVGPTINSSSPASDDFDPIDTLPALSGELFANWARRQSELLCDFEECGSLRALINSWQPLTSADHRPAFISDVFQTGDYVCDIGPFWSGLTAALTSIRAGGFDGTSISDNGPQRTQRRGLPQEILERMDYLAKLPNNWDGEGATPVSQVTINRLKELLERATANVGDLPAPFISPAHDGMLVAEWDIPGGKELIIDVPLGTSPLEFLLTEIGDAGEEIEIDGEIGAPWTVGNLFRRFLAR